jgi:transcription initiation factor TFIIH subunit 1
MDVDLSMMDSDAGRYDLRNAIGVLEDSDSEDDEEEKVGHVGSKASLVDAQKQILEGVKARRIEIDGSSAQSSLSGLSQRIFDRLTLTHATTTEFLHHFWLVFLSGDSDRAGELAKMVETLERAMDRINAVATDAEKEREEIILREKQHIKDLWEQTGKKKKFDPNLVGGGEKVVKEMMEPTIKTLQKASKEYRKALAAEGIDTS